MKAVFYTCIGLGLAAFFTGCIEENMFPPEPVIQSTEFEQPIRNLVLRFTDGDGNMGLAPADTLSPFNALNPDGSENRFHYNLWVNLFFRSEGVWVPAPIPGTLDFRILDLTPEGQNKQIDARVTYEMATTLNDLIETEIIAEGDTFRFDVQVVDRSLNVSPTMSTESFVLD